MKKFLLLLLVNLATSVYSQDTFLNFKIFNDRIIWQKVYETSFWFFVKFGGTSSIVNK